MVRETKDTSTCRSVFGETKNFSRKNFLESSWWNQSRLRPIRYSIKPGLGSWAHCYQGHLVVSLLLPRTFHLWKVLVVTKELQTQSSLLLPMARQRGQDRLRVGVESCWWGEPVNFLMRFAVRVRSTGQKYGPTFHQRDRADVTEFVTLVRLSSLGQHVGVLALAGYKRRKSALTAGPIAWDAPNHKRQTGLKFVLHHRTKESPSPTSQNWMVC